MTDIPCIYKMSMINEKDTLKEDIINGKALDILLILLSGSKTIKEIAKELNIAGFSVQLYVQRLIDSKLIKVTEIKVSEGRVEKTYELVSTDVEILNYLKNNCKSDDSRNDVELSAQHFSLLTKEIIRNIDKYKNKPHKIKAYFIKADEAQMWELKKELDTLFEKYQAMENLDSTDTYGFISVFAPYRLKE